MTSGPRVCTGLTRIARIQSWMTGTLLCTAKCREESLLTRSPPRKNSWVRDCFPLHQVVQALLILLLCDNLPLKKLVNHSLLPQDELMVLLMLHCFPSIVACHRNVSVGAPKNVDTGPLMAKHGQTMGDDCTVPHYLGLHRAHYLELHRAHYLGLHRATLPLSSGGTPLAQWLRGTVGP